MPGRGVSREEYKSRHDPPEEIRHLRAEVSRLEAELERRKQAGGELQLVLEDLKGAVHQAEPVELDYEIVRQKAGADSPCSLVVHLTDWQIGQTTVAGEVEGFGEFNYDIAERRVDELLRRILRKVAVQRTAYQLDECVVLGTADWVSGDIHDELIVTNEFPAPVQAVRAGYLLGGFLAGLAPHFKSVRAEILTLDNHGRLTRKSQAAQGGYNNWGYVVGTLAQLHCERLKNVSVKLWPQSSFVVPVAGEQYLCFHGHEIRGWAGRPWYGFTRRLEKEALARMDAEEDLHFTKLVFGHWHVANNDQHWLVGGSLPGTSAFDHSQGRHAPPHQTSWLVHPRYGEFDWTRWWLE